MIGFETVGNATLICYDRTPVLVTDPWISGRAYFGSWGLTHEIPIPQLDSILNAEYLWFSHGHPDHLDADSLDRFQNKKILLPNHVGARIYHDLASRGYNVSILPDREWVELSHHIRVLCISDYYQDSLLLLDINGRLVVNLNDATDRGWGRFVRKIIKNYDVTFLLKLISYGDPDMNNFFSETGERIPVLQRFSLGQRLQFWAELYGVRYVVPFSSFHRYQRADSIWANDYVATFEDYKDGLTSNRFELLPPFISYDCVCDTLSELRPAKTAVVVHQPDTFGDTWSDQLQCTDVTILEDYFRSIESLSDHLDYVRLRVGKRDMTISVSSRNFKRGITFEVPRSSLMTAVRYEIFDDLLIGNFMKTTVHHLAPRDFNRYFTAPAAKFADNGRAKSKNELKAYLQAYRRRAYLDFIVHSFERESERRFRSFVHRDSAVFEWAKRGYRLLKA
ncbi:MAG: MBL fold metallo-hydrolase [Proteobacteria bacterium]|nr:MBL fold metallo-hydrolase [Pseudomonadota bacterium]